MWLTRFSLARPTVIVALFIALVVFGAVSLSRLGRSSDPPGTTFPIVIVSANYPGASPQDMEKLVVKPIEDQMDGVDYLDQMTASAQEGTATLVVQFKMGTNLDLAAVDVQRRVDTARVYMPTDLNPPDVEKNGASEPLLDIAVSSKSLTQPQIADLVNNQVEPLMKQIPGVQTVDVYGAADREFHVEPDPARLVGANATLSDVFNAVAVDNNNVPGGLMTQPTREATVAIHAYIDNAADLLAVPLSPTGQQTNLRVGDVANVYDSHVEMRSISHYNGQPRVYVELGRDINADELNTTATARAQLKTIEAQFPQLHFVEIDAPADYTSRSLVGVAQSLIEGIILTSIVMMLFLHAWRNAVVVMISIPTSIFATFILMNLFQFHIDSMSMMGLSLIIGILVDDSIVVLENITRHRDMGEDPMSAAINGRTEIGSAAVAITMVDVVVFLPVAFLPGIVGAYLKEFAAVVVIATLFSLLVSFTLTPLLAAKWSVLRRELAPPKWLDALNSVKVDLMLVAAALAIFSLGLITQLILLKVLGIFIGAVLILNWFVHRYDRLLESYRKTLLPFALEHGSFVVFTCAVLFLNAFLLTSGGQSTIVPDAVILVGLCVAYFAAWLRRSVLRRKGVKPRGFATLGSYRPLTIATFIMPPVLCVLMIALGGLNFDFVPAQQNGEIDMTVTYPSGTPIATTDKFVVGLEDQIMKLDGVKSVSSTVGRKPSGYGSSIGGNYAQLNATMADNRTGDTNKTAAKIRDMANFVPGGVLQVAGDSGNGSAIFYALTGPEDQIGPAAEKVAAFLRTVPGSVNVQTSAEVAAPRLNVDVDAQKAELLGVSPGDAANIARIAVDGAVATRVRTSTGLVDVRVQFPLADRSEVEQLENVRVRANNGALVPLSSIATFTWTTAPTKIERLNRERVVNVLGDILPGYSLGAVTGPLQAKLNEPGFLPEGVGLVGQGQTQWATEALVNMGLALVFSFALVYVLMVILYGSFLEPLIVMFSVPLAIIGAFIFLAVMGRLQPEQGQSLNIISGIGIIMLFGLVSKNGILLVDYSNTLVKRGLHVREAVLEASTTRFRPIIMTTAAMIFGMLPLTLGLAEGGEWRQAIGTVIIGGLLSSLVLTLFLIPMIYNTWIGWIERRKDRKAVYEEMTPIGEPASV